MSDGTPINRLEHQIEQAQIEELKRQEQTLVKSVAPIHDCRNHQKGGKCEVCARTQETAVKVAAFYNEHLAGAESTIRILVDALLECAQIAGAVLDESWKDMSIEDGAKVAVAAVSSLRADYQAALLDEKGAA